MLTSLPMYDLEPLREATDAWWSCLARALRGCGFDPVPERLDRGDFGDRFAHWSAPDLLLSQTCGYPLTHDFADKVRLVATPCYDTPHTQGADYCSVVLVKQGDPADGLEALRGRRVAVNGFDSQSGFNALRALIAPLARDGRFFGATIETGRHHLSLEMVAQGDADLCAIDCVSYALMADTMPEAIAATRILTTTSHAPSLPYVTANERSDAEVSALQDALNNAVADPDSAAPRKRLRLTGFAMLERSSYDRIDAMEQQAIDQGYGVLA
ncbi:MAG: phosphate ABC transporter substrate-binding protein [Rhodospirillaceae bacterium]|nr:phosphate ABC transporter substrate-binding protein [Rhodospirillaceae bacterium]|tara:strand:- start:118 stop:927 length:810 start_codon:yes stop_codon:yes gene_type:complete